MTDEEAKAIMRLERRLTEWIREQPLTVEGSLMVLGITAARLIYGVTVLGGGDAGVKAARLLDSSVAQALALFRGKAETPPRLH